MSILSNNRWVAPLAIGGALGASLFAGGLSLTFAAAAGAGIALGIRTPILRDILANKAAIALGCISFALVGGDMKFANNIPSFSLSLLMESMEHHMEFMLAGFAGLLASRSLRAEIWDNRTRDVYQTISREVLGTALGIAGFISGNMAGAYASGSKLFNFERLRSIAYNPLEGYDDAFWESRKQIHEIMMKGYNVLRENIEGAQSIRERIQDAIGTIGHIFNQTAPQQVNKLQTAQDFAANPDIQAAMWVMGLGIAVAAPAYMLGKRLIFRTEAYPDGFAVEQARKAEQAPSRDQA